MKTVFLAASIVLCGFYLRAITFEEIVKKLTVELSASNSSPFSIPEKIFARLICHFSVLF